MLRIFQGGVDHLGLAGSTGDTVVSLTASAGRTGSIALFAGSPISVVIGGVVCASSHTGGGALYEIVPSGARAADSASGSCADTAEGVARKTRRTGEVLASRTGAGCACQG